MLGSSDYRRIKDGRRESVRTPTRTKGKIYKVQTGIRAIRIERLSKFRLSGVALTFSHLCILKKQIKKRKELSTYTIFSPPTLALDFSSRTRKRERERERERESVCVCVGLRTVHEMKLGGPTSCSCTAVIESIGTCPAVAWTYYTMYI